MKKHIGKKTLSLLLAVLMVLTAIPLAVVPAAAAGGTFSYLGWAVIGKANREKDGTSFTVCSDGKIDQTSVGFLDFKISSQSSPVENATLTIKASRDGNFNGEAFAEIFSIDPDKRPNIGYGANTLAFSSVFGSNENDFKMHSYTSAENAKKNLGIISSGGKEVLTAVGVIRTTDLVNGGNETELSFDLTEAVNNAIRNNQQKLCLAILNARSYNGNGGTWSDINVRHASPTLTYTSASLSEANKLANYVLYSGSDRGNANQLTVCSDGTSGNTTAAFLKFDISSIPSNATVSLSTSAWCANSANTESTAEVYSVDPDSAPSVIAGAFQTNTDFGKIFKTFATNSTVSATEAKAYFGISGASALGTIKASDLSTSSSKKTVTIDVSSAVKEAKANNKNTICLMLINPKSFNGSNTKKWSDINIAPSETKLVYSENSASSAYGNFKSGLYYVRVIMTSTAGNWNNNANIAYLYFKYKETNGTGDEKIAYMPIAPGTFAANSQKTFDFVLDGYPTDVQTHFKNKDISKRLTYSANSLLVGSSLNNLTEIDTKKATNITLPYATSGTWTDNRDLLTPNNAAQYPYAKTFDWKNTPEETFVPKSGANTVLGSVVAKDQYGVIMGTEYTAKIEKTAKSGSLSTIAGTGLSVSKQSSSDFTVSVAESAKVLDTDYFYGKLTVEVADANNSQIGKNFKEFKIENQKENISIDPNGGSLSKESYVVYYGSSLNAEINKKLNGASYPPTGTREGYTLKGIYYGSSKVEDNEKIYSDANYTAQWNINKYTVKFYNSEGKVISNQTVDYGNSASEPAEPEKAYDSENHYTFEKWDNDFSVVKSDLEIKPVFTAAAHTLEHDARQDIEAKCDKDGQLYYVCSCGYNEYRPGKKSTGHDWKETRRINAGCETEGTIYYTCNICESTKSETISPAGHKYEKTTVNPATCEKTGLDKYICSACKNTDPSNGGDSGVVTIALGHDWTEWEITTEATCDSDGLRRHLCKRDGCEYKTKYQSEVINKSGHKWSDEIYTENSTCKNQGKTYKKCLNKNCSATLTVETLPLAPHTLNDWTTITEPTCVKKGLKAQVCSVCKENQNVTELDAIGHKYEDSAYTEYLDATCTEPAKERAKCSRCDTFDIRNVKNSVPLGHDCPEDGYVSDNNATCTKDGTLSSKCVRFDECKYKATKPDEGSALGHDFKGYVYNKDATCTKNETKTGTCSRCFEKGTVEVPGTKLPHDVVYSYNGDATCTKNGTKSGICSMCKNEITVEASNTKIPHSFTKYEKKSDATCLADAIEEAVCDYGCGKVDCRYIEGTKGEHNFPDPETEKELYVSNNDATCKAGGTMTALCKICKKAKKTVADPDSKPAHNIVYWVSDGNATCTEDGTKHGSCVYGCGYKEENIPDNGSALKHLYRDYVYNNDATCIKDGTRTARCERKFATGELDSEGKPIMVRCEETETLNAEGSALGHEWSEWKLVGEAANCEKGGKRERHCLREGCVDQATGKPASQSETAAPLGHNYQWKNIGSGEINCETGGEKVKVCSVCGNIDESSRTQIPAAAHNYGVTEYVAPTCTKTGKRVVSCTVCKKIFSDVTIDATGHINYSLDKASVKAATCKEEGYTGDQRCDECNAIVKKGDVIPVTNSHVFKEYTIIKQATCLENATEKAGCDICGKAENEREVPGSALGHTFSNYVSDGNATCTGISSKTSKCDRCDVTDTIKEYGTALGHDWSDWVTVTEATCSNKGLAERACKREGCNVKVTKDLRKLSHKESDWIVDKEPTCTEKGHRYKKCTAGCGYVFEEELVDAKGHDYVISKSTATCLDDGYSTYTCTVCGTEKKGEIIRALGHERSEWVITKEATCKNRGEKQSTCTRCGKLLATEYIEKTAHRDNDGDGKCDDCQTDISNHPSTNCGCICHKTSWIMRVLYAICRFFWKLFRFRSTCPCGAKHY